MCRFWMGSDGWWELGGWYYGTVYEEKDRVRNMAGFSTRVVLGGFICIFSGHFNADAMKGLAVAVSTADVRTSVSEKLS
jgi:hypothetical protein